MDDATLNAQRNRWERVRERSHLINPQSEDFAISGLAHRVIQPSVRFLVLPTDPTRNFIDFTPDLWEWWLANRADPVTNEWIRWSLDSEPTASAAVRYTREGQGWGEFLALYRTGSLELEVGKSGAVTGADNKRYFRLTYAVGQIWFCLGLYPKVIDRFHLGGPWEITIALQRTKEAYLSHFAEGWAEPRGGAFTDARGCSDTNLLWHHELLEWPDEAGVRSLAFRIGGWIEDAWGSRERRYLARSGPMIGHINPTAYRRFP